MSSCLAFCPDHGPAVASGRARVAPVHPAGGATAPDPAAMRRSYEAAGVDADDLGPDPGVACGRWFAEAASAGIIEPNAMVLATVGADGAPAARTVLLKG